MTIPRKGSRPIVVDGIEYRWRVRHRPTHSQGVLDHSLTVAVDAAEGARCTLVVDLAQSHPCNWLGDPARPVTPAEIAGLIREARQRGWEPMQAGKAFRMSVSDAGR